MRIKVFCYLSVKNLLMLLRNKKTGGIISPKLSLTQYFKLKLYIFFLKMVKTTKIFISCNIRKTTKTWVVIIVIILHM